MSKTDKEAEGYGIKFLAEEVGAEASNVRHALRKLKVEKNDGRYNWTKKSEALEIAKKVKAKMAADKEAAKDRPKPTFGKKAKDGDEPAAKGKGAKVNKDAVAKGKDAAKGAKAGKGKKASKDE